MRTPLTLAAALFLSLSALTGCSGAPDAPASEDSTASAQRGRGGAASATTADGDGSFAACVQRGSGFGSISYFNTCAKDLSLAYCNENDPYRPCTAPPRGILQSHTALGFTRGHCSPGQCAADGVRDVVATCYPPAVPVPRGGNLALGYTCE